MTFEELSSKLGALHTNVLSEGEVTKRRTFNNIVVDNASNKLLFNDLSESANISVRQSKNSEVGASKNYS